MERTARTPKLLIAAVAIGLAALGLKWFAGANTGAGGQPDRRSGSFTSARGPSSAGQKPGSRGAQRGGPLIVQVAGLVRRPGVYRLPVGARTFQAIEAAGGSLGRGDPGSLQLAARLADGARVEVPAKARAAVASAPGGAAAAAGPGAGPAGPVSLSSATVEQLDSLDGIGPALAKRIIEWRQAHGGFSSISELDRVPGIGPAKYEAIKDSVVP
ncbi:MAG: helix-hairpin-helix domain-containing protein [Actinomycetes bacterium]